MSVLIKGMDMPEHCEECYFRDWQIIDGMFLCDCPAGDFQGTNITIEVEGYYRHPNCPLLEAEKEVPNGTDRPV